MIRRPQPMPGSPYATGLTPDERRVFDLSVDFWNAYLRLPEYPNGLTEALPHLHALQEKILSRPVYRALKVEELRRLR